MSIFLPGMKQVARLQSEAHNEIIHNLIATREWVRLLWYLKETVIDGIEHLLNRVHIYMKWAYWRFRCSICRRLFGVNETTCTRCLLRVYKA